MREVLIFFIFNINYLSVTCPVRAGPGVGSHRGQGMRLSDALAKIVERETAGCSNLRAAG